MTLAKFVCYPAILLAVVANVRAAETNTVAAGDFFTQVV